MTSLLTQSATTEETQNIFKNTVIRIVPSALGKTRLNLLENLVLRHGGRLTDDDDPLKCASRSSSCMYVVVADDSLTADTIEKILSTSSVTSGVDIIVKVSWISECLRKKRLVDVSPFQFKSSAAEKIPQNLIKSRENNGSGGQVLGISRSDCVTIIGEDVDINVGTISTNVVRPNIDPMKFICSRPSASQNVNHNQHITDKLELLAATYKMTQDRWRAIGYERAIAALKRHPKEIVAWEEARSLSAIGDRLADKIWEIIESGRLRKMDAMTSDEKTIAMQLFANVWGIGPTTAQLLVQKGYRTLDDLTTANCLNRQQTIGLRHYEDLRDRMSRDEATKIERIVREASLAIQSGVVAVTCGSYRRCKHNCGDVDVLVTHPDGKSHCGLLSRIVSSLKQIGFLTDDLVAHEENGAQHKYMGVCRLPENASKHRRLDIIVVPYSEFACSLLYFTGSAHFNRSIRLLARKVGMSLSEHSLNVGVIRKGQRRLCEGSPLPTPNERSIFEHLGLPYRSPEERDH